MFTRSPYRFSTFKSYTGDGTSQAFLAADVEGMSSAHITVETAAVQVRFDSGNAATDGHQIAVGESLTLEGHENLVQFRFSQAGVLKVSFAVDVAV